MFEIVACENGHPNAALARLQHEQMVLLAALLDFCHARGLAPFLAAGSALGAARHRDIIPWDDDIDVGMLRKDFERLIADWARDPVAGLFLQSRHTERNYPYAYAKLRRRGTAIIEETFAETDLEDGIFIDIFPYDAAPRSAAGLSLKLAALTAINLVVMSYSRHAATIARHRAVRGTRLLAFHLRRFLPWRTLARLRDRIAVTPPGKASDALICYEMYGILHARRTLVAKAAVVPPRRVAFGAGEVPAPADPDAYLTGLFGDYRTLPPPKQRRPIHIAAVRFAPDSLLWRFATRLDRVHDGAD